MMRLIDADALLEDGIRVQCGYNADGLLMIPMRDVTQSIKNAPTVDAVVLPCKLGDPVYIIRECSCYCADYHRKNKRRKCSDKVYIGQKQQKDHCGYVTEANFKLSHIADFGKTVFLTREEAEAALAKMG